MLKRARKYGLRQLKIPRLTERISSIEARDLTSLRKRLLSIEGGASKLYFNQIFMLFDARLRPEQRHTFHAYDG